jgi:citrate lyase subunit beta/citryl-CoA lyase
MTTKENSKMVASLRRSALYVPGDSETMLQKSAAVSSDMLLLNLEDGVALSKKIPARENVAGALLSVDFGEREVVVRINPLNTEIGRRDLAKIIPVRPDGICLPKVETSAEIQAVDDVISDLEAGYGAVKGSVGLHAMIESASGVLHAQEIALASPRMRSLIFGAADYVADVRCRPGEDRLELLLALQMIVIAAHSAGIDAIDAPCFDLRNCDLLSREAAHARRLGFDGKSALHPDQLAIINQVFDVSPEEIEWAEQTVMELDKAENRGKALTTVAGKLIDNPHRSAAMRILSRRKPQ